MANAGQLTMDEAQTADSLRQEQHKSRMQKAGETGKNVGRGMQAGGAVAQAGGGAMQMAGKATNATGKVARKGGQGMMRAGARLSSTGLGAIAGVPLMAAGAGLTAAGVGAQAVGKTADAAGKGVRQAGKATGRAGKNVKGMSNQLMAAAALRESKMADKLIKTAMPAPLKVGVKVAKMAGIDVMKWFKRGMIIGIVMQFVYIVGAIILITMALYVVKESLIAVFTNPIDAFKAFWGILTEGASGQK